MKSTTSLRLDNRLREGLARLAAIEGVSVTALVERIIREALAVADYPEIVFRSGPSGRRAALAGGPDVWEIAAALRPTTGSETERVAALAEEFGLHERQVVLALDYAAAHEEEISERVRANDQALEEAERVASARKRLFA